MSFSVDNDELNFSAVQRLITERQSVLADLDFEILDLSQGKIIISLTINMMLLQINKCRCLLWSWRWLPWR